MTAGFATAHTQDTAWRLGGRGTRMSISRSAVAVIVLLVNELPGTAAEVKSAQLSPQPQKNGSAVPAGDSKLLGE
jgi:hypothetical protein